MNREEVKNKVLNILEELSGTRPTSEDVQLILDFHLDSLRLVTLLVLIEEEFNIELNECDMNPFALIATGDVIDMTLKYVGGE